MWLIVQYHGPKDQETQHQAQLFPNTGVEFDRQLSPTYQGPEKGSEVLGSKRLLLPKVPSVKWPSKCFSNCPDNVHHFYCLLLPMSEIFCKDILSFKAIMYIKTTKLQNFLKPLLLEDIISEMSRNYRGVQSPVLSFCISTGVTSESWPWTEIPKKR